QFSAVLWAYRAILSVPGGLRDSDDPSMPIPIPHGNRRNFRAQSSANRTRRIDLYLDTLRIGGGPCLPQLKHLPASSSTTIERSAASF
ncbi:MAG: hypothetical protein Q9187_008158, partial [Circinaria calcarea]